MTDAGRWGSLDGFHLPGPALDAIERWEVLPVPGTGDPTIRVPVLSAAHLDAVWSHLAAARRERFPGGAARGVARVLARAAARVRRAAGRPPYREAVAGTAGLSPLMLDEVLDGMASGWTAEGLEALLVAEFGAGSFPHDFAPDPTRPGVLTRAVAPPVAFHVFAGNVPGVAITSIMRSLLVGSAVFGKTAREGVLLPALFARALGEEDPALAACVAVTWWPGGDEALVARALELAELAVVYGGEDAVHTARARAPATTRVVVHGPAVSAAVVLRPALRSRKRAGATAADAARAVATFEQRGCTSPVAVLVEEGAAVSPEEFGDLLGTAFERLASDLPSRHVADAMAARKRQILDAAELAEAEGRARALRGSGWGVVIRPTLEPADLCTDRLVQVVGVPDTAAAVDALRPLAGRIQTLGVEGDAEAVRRIAGASAPLGVSRVTSLLGMPWPPPAWRHDGSHPLRELVRWLDLEI